MTKKKPKKPFRIPGWVEIPLSQRKPYLDYIGIEKIPEELVGKRIWITITPRRKIWKGRE